MSNSCKSNRERHNLTSNLGMVDSRTSDLSKKTFHGGTRRPKEKWLSKGLFESKVSCGKSLLLILVLMVIACSSSVMSSKTRRNSSPSVSTHDEPVEKTSPTFLSFSSPQHVHHHSHHHHRHRHSRRHYRHPPDGDRDAVVNVFTIFDPTQAPTNQNHTTATIQRLVVDPSSGTVYVGASNSLYQLSPELSIAHNLTTGPLMDNPYCPPPHSSCECLISGCKEEKPTSTDSIVRTMVIDQKDEKLIVCYSLFKGHCRKYLLGNISVAETPRYTMMVPSDENSSVVMFIAPGPPNPASTDVLYIATTRSNKGLMAYKDSVPTICTRNIQDFEFVSSDILVPSKIDVEIQQREIFKVHYVHGFSSLGFSYFLSLQKTSVKNVTLDRLVSRISRICHGDKTLYSYTEIPFECWVPEPLPSNGADSSDADDDDFGISSSRRRSSMHSQRQRSATNYNVLLAAAVIRPGSLLAKRLGLSDVPPMSELEDVLVGVFGAQDPYNTSSGSVPAASSSVGGNLNDNMGTNQGNHDSGVGPGAALPGSAICVYPMRDVRRIFTETIQSCFEGIGNIGPDHFVQPIPCKTAKFEITDEYCGEYDVNHPIIGSNPISSSAAVLLDRVKVTSLAATTANDETVLFVGTDRGDVRKVKINSENEAVEYDRITVEPGVPVGRDLNFDPQHKHLYAFLNQTVYRVAVEKCATYETCGECIGAGDPYCGWCSLKKRCTAKDMCSDSHLSLRWLSSGSCARIVKVVSNQAQKISNSTSLVIMTVQNLPVSLSGDYYCTFSGHGVSRLTSANITSDRIHGHDRHGGNVTLKCETPRANLLPPFPTGKDHILMTLSLTSDELDHLSTNFTFFDCSVHNSCTKCTTSSYPCTWCTQSNRCTGNKEDCMADTLITGVKVPGNSDTPGPAYCPRIENIIANSSEILIPSGSELALRVRVIQYQPFQSPLRCSFSFNGGHEVEARLVGSDVIECSPIKFDYSSSTHFRNVPFGITWGDEGRKNLDNPTNVQVRIFKCQEMASNCGRCRAVDFRLNCGWCRHPGAPGEEGRCTTRSSCSHDAWMLHSQPCRDAYVIDVFPRKGPLEGGTLLTVKGENLGLEPQDTEVYIRGLPCKVIHYDPSIEFICVTSNSSELSSSSLAVTVSHNVTFASDVHFSYVTSKLSSVHPLLGPKSGGSILTVSGHNLDSGSNVTVELSSSSSGRSTPCIVRDRTSDWLKCITATSDPTYTADRLEVTIDRSSVGLNSELGLFTFMKDPVITSVDNKKAILGGGNLIIVRGERLHVVSSPRMVVYRDEDRFTSPCTVVSDIEMICLFPNVTSSRSVPPIFGHRHYRPHPKSYGAPSAKSSDPRSSHPRKSREVDDPKLLQDFWTQGSNRESAKLGESSDVNQNSRDLKNRSPATVEPLAFHYGFIMDGVKSLLNFSDTFQVYPDPEVEPFEGGTKKGYSNKLEHFTINGHHLDLALSKNDYRVTIGDEECEVTSLSASYLMCSMKHIYNVPSSAGVMVYVGNLTVHHLGTLEHEGWPKSPLTSMPFLLGIGGTVLFLIIMVVTICWCYRVKTKRNTRVMRRLKNQMDILESRVAKECKEAFAELQTDMTDVSQNYMGKIPFRDYRSFCANVLFPGVSVDHSVFRWGTGTGLPPHLLPATPNSQHQQLLLQQQNLQQQLDNSYSTCSSLDPVGAESLLLAFSPTNTGLSGKGLFSRAGQLKDQLALDSSGKGPRTASKMAAESTANTLNNSSTSFISSICLNLTRDSLKEVEGLLLNRSFLLTLIRTLESRKDFIVREKVNFASLLSVALQPFMDYHTDILKTLLSDLIERAMEKQNHPKLLLRRTESVAEKMLTNWFAFLLFKFLKDRAGEKLFMLFRAVKQQVEKGPVDQLTSEARYSLSEEKLIRQHVDFQIMTLQVPDPESGNQQPIHQVKVLDCDTISQVKEKILDVVYRHSGFSTRPSKDGLDIEWINPSNSQSFILQDEDESNEMSGEYKKLNTLAHYRLPDQSFVSLVTRQNPYGNLHQKLENFSGSLPSSYSLSHNIPLVAQSSIKNCHLVKSNEQDNHKDDRGSKMVSEVYLTRLLATKGTLQTFVDDLFQTIFSCDSTSPANYQQNSLLPLAIKYMFDFFDDQATHHGICDPEVVHTWKSNSLPLRFWVNIVKNPDFVFDIHKSNIVDACLSVIGQTFMDSCCMSDHKLSKDSPSSKLLYAKDIPKYKSWVIKYYEDIKQMPSLGEHEMMEVLKRESQIHMKEFNTEEALREISRYVFKYYDDFTQALLEDEFCRRDRLSERLDAIHRRSISS